MKLYAGRVANIAEEIIRSLRDQEAIDVRPEQVQEAELDVQSVLKEYLRVDRDLTNRARALSEEGHGSVGSIKKRLAFDSAFKTGPEAIDYVVDQLLETFMHSTNIDEIYWDDLDLRRHISQIIKRYMEEDETVLEREVRERIKNLTEGSRAWDQEYDRVMQQLMREKKYT
ncbi:MAG: DUF507 family protein [Bradymonadales bacterium]|nr:DUF507 family protein [Bradymonadales bacterium]